MKLEYYRSKLEQAGVRFASGLSEAEAQHAETTYGFRFPPDLRAFLMYALPVSAHWPNWREELNSEILQMMSWPVEGICFDISNNVFWPEEWGARPASANQACEIAGQKVAEAPKLIPVSGHRYIPSSPEESGNPVFSVYQTDIIYYGADLWNYLENEFSYYFEKPQYYIREPVKEIPFWTWLVERNC